MSILGRLVRNIATNWVGLAINIVISFFLAPYVVNSLGATYYGIWAVTLQFTGYLYLMDFGVRDAVIYYIARFHARHASKKVNEVVRVAMEAYFPIFLGAVALSIGGGWVFPKFISVEGVPDSSISLVFFLTGITIAQGFLFNVFTGVLNGLQRFDVGNYIGVSIGIVRAGLIVFALDAGYGIVGLAWIQLGVSLFSSVLNLIAARIILRRNGIEMGWVSIHAKRRIVLIRRMLGYSVFVFISNIGQKTNAAAGALIIAYFLPVAQVTPYAIAASLSGYSRSLIQASSWVFNPLVSQYAALNDTKGLIDAICRGTKLAMVVGLPVLTSFILVGDIFIGLWMGPEFIADAAMVLLVLSIMELISAPHHVMSGALWGMNKHQELAWLRIGEAVANVLLSIFLVQRYGIVGAAVGALIPHLLLVLLFLPLLLRKHVQMPIRALAFSALGRPLLAVVPFAVLVNLVFSRWSPTNLVEFFVAIGALTGVYAAGLYPIALDDTERKVVRDYIDRWSNQRRDAT